MAAIVQENIVDWDAYREAYPYLTFNELEAVCDNIDSLYPHQRQFTAIHFYRMLSALEGELSVIELGCHDGHLADRMLSRFDNITSWTGYDFNAPIERTVCKDFRYNTVALENWFHKTDIPQCDVFIASHVLEHFSVSQCTETLLHIEARHILIEVPINEQGRDWNNWNCTHVLSWGLRHLRAWLAENSFKIFYEVPALGIFGITKEPSNG